MARVTQTLVAALVLCLVAGCGTITSVDTGSEGPSPSAVDSRISANYANLGLTIEEVRLLPTRGGVKEAQVDVRNTKFGQNAFGYRFEWVEASGRVLDSRTSVWSVATIESGGRKTIRSVAPSEAADNFRLELRDAD